MKATTIKSAEVNMLSVYTSGTGDISFGPAVKTDEPKKKPATRTRERINGRKFS